MLAGDKIHAVIRSCAASSDGKAPGIYAPVIEGQELCIRRAYQHAGVDPTAVTMVEGHGTGTPVGDSIELTALKNVLEGAESEVEGPKRERVAVGSIKSNIGHLKAVAGAAGMLKVRRPNLYYVFFRPFNDWNPSPTPYLSKQLFFHISIKPRLPLRKSHPRPNATPLSRLPLLQTIAHCPHSSNSRLPS